MKTINVKSWNETEGRTRFMVKGILPDGRKYTEYAFGYKKYEGIKQVYKNGKWQEVA